MEKTKPYKALYLAFLIGLICLYTPVYADFGYNTIGTQTSLGVYEDGKCIELIQLCGDCTFNQLTSIIYPNTTKITLDAMMTKRGTEFNYTYCFPNKTGEYLVNGVGDLGSVNTSWAYTILLTDNGKDPAGSSVIVFFSFMFLIVLGFFLYSLIMNIGHFASLDLDAIDMAKSMGTYFVLLGLYSLGIFYLGNPHIDSMLLILIRVGGFTHIVFPIIGFFLSIMIGSLRKKKVDFGTKRIYRRQKIG